MGSHLKAQGREICERTLGRRRTNSAPQGGFINPATATTFIESPLFITGVGTDTMSIVGIDLDGRGNRVARASSPRICDGRLEVYPTLMSRIALVRTVVGRQPDFGRHIFARDTS